LNIQLLSPTGDIDKIIGALRDKKNISVFGLPFYSRAIALSALSSFLYVCADYVKATEAFEQLKSIRGREVAYIPPLDDVLSIYKGNSDNNLVRLSSLSALASGKAKIGVTSVLGYLQLYPRPADVCTHTLSLEKDKSYDLDEITKKLAKSGYARVAQCESPGEFALRGDILDIAPVDCAYGYRIDFFGDMIEEIRRFDLDTQFASATEAQITVPPNSEIFNLNAGAEEIIKKSLNKKLEPPFLARQEALSEELFIKIDGGSFAGLNCLKPLAPSAAISDYFDVIIFDEQKQCADNLTAHLSEHRSRLTTLLERGETFVFAQKQLSEALNCGKTMASFDKLLCQNRIFSPAAVFNFKEPEIGGYAKNMQGFADDIKIWLRRGQTVKIYAGEVLSQNLKEFLTENSLPTSIVSDGGTGGLCENGLYKGGLFFDQSLVLLGYGDLTFKKRPAPSKSKKAEFFRPKLGDFVVHNVHGIGVCEGLKRMKLGESERDFVVVRYEGGDKLYVAAESINLLSAYAGEEDPKLNKIGGAEFARIKEKVKASIKKMAFDLRELYSKREEARGHKYSPDHAALSAFEADFPYEETPDQLVAISECLSDLTRGKVMDRLLCGDVGYGKTEVAMRIAYKAVLEGKQAAFISPTTILARQHFRTLTTRMEKFGVNVRSLTRFDSDRELTQTLKDLQAGLVDVVCGTHRALSKDVIFKDLGLLVLDEEQRFGVTDKEKIKLLKTDVGVLSLSATPIPRTLHMAMSGIRDISLLTTPPPGRIPVSTYVAEYTDSLVFDAVQREKGRGGQVFIVYNRVEKIDKFASGIASMFPGLKVGVAHGQMEKTRLEDTLARFINGETDILITSTIIENGIDMPNVNTMVVVDADRLGLGQLYQLRGRIGRAEKLAYAFFTYDGKKILTENAYKRLDAITGYTDFGSGFKLAMRDLEIRGAGNVLGREQHGHMQQVGYELYLKLIGEVMDEIAGRETEEAADVSVITDFPAFIPEDYIGDIEWRLKVYRRIALAADQKDAADELVRLKDVYGRPPRPVRNLLTVAVIKNMAGKIGGQKVYLTKNKCEVLFKANALSLGVIKRASEAGFSYSAAANSVFTRPAADSVKKLVGFLGES